MNRHVNIIDETLFFPRNIIFLLHCILLFVKQLHYQVIKEHWEHCKAYLWHIYIIPFFQVTKHNGELDRE